ncbi:CG0192-related protein [Micromonospora sp. BQ11]|uniref:CG0192-related protein n=1 Tax=Micromonospora sp. BQ11 TaxID=3452212 RepID=UPI003F89F245
MALLHRAEIRPTKLELLATWLPEQPWFRGGTGTEVERVAAYRFDDPAGEVGIETMLVRVGDGPVHQVPLTYRGAPLPGADDRLVGTTHHSVLGERWVYDGCGDPVYAATLADAILAGTGQAEEFFSVDGRREVRPPNMTVAVDGTAGAGAPDDGGERIATDAADLAVLRRPAEDAALTGRALTGTWPGQPTPLPLAYAWPRR